MSLIFKKMIELKKAIDHIKKDQINKGQGFKFRGIDQIYNQIHSKAADIGVFTVPKVLQSTVRKRVSKNGGVMLHVILKVKYTFYAEDGSSIQSIVYGEALDSGDKAFNKCLSIAHKYLLLQTFMIPTEEGEENNDPDYYSHQLVQPRSEREAQHLIHSQKNIVINKIKNLLNDGYDKEELLKKLGVANSAEILSEKNIENVMDWITLLDSERVEQTNKG